MLNGTGDLNSNHYKILTNELQQINCKQMILKKIIILSHLSKSNMQNTITFNIFQNFNIFRH